VNKQESAVLQGVVQGSATWPKQVKVPWIVSPFAFVLSISIAGIASACFLVLRGFLRAGLDLYLPEGFGQAAQRSMRRLTSRYRACEPFRVFLGMILSALE